MTATFMESLSLRMGNTKVSGTGSLCRRPQSTLGSPLIIESMLPMLIGLALGQEPTEVPPTDPHIRYIGRWDFRDPQGPRAEWSASAFEFRFQGKQVTVHLGG